MKLSNGVEITLPDFGLFNGRSLVAKHEGEYAIRFYRSEEEDDGAPLLCMLLAPTGVLDLGEGTTDTAALAAAFARVVARGRGMSDVT